MRTVSVGVIFGLACLSYPLVFETVGYMFEFNLLFSTEMAVISAAFLILMENLRHERDVVFLIIQNFVLMPTFVVNCYFYQSMALMMALGTLGFLGAYLSWVVDRVHLRRLRAGWVPEKKLNYGLIILYLYICFLTSPSVFTSINPVASYLESYETRADLQLNGALGYFMNSCVFLIIPAAIYAISERNKLLYMFAAFAISIIYTLMPLTLYILLFILISAVSFAYYHMRLSLHWLINVFLAGVLLTSLFNAPLIDIIINRFFYIIGVTNIFYYDYFSQNPLFLFEGSFLEPIFGGSAYSTPPGIVIDNLYYQALGTNQSTGFLGSAYANGGEFFVIFSYFLVTAYALIIKWTVDRDQEKIIHALLAFCLINIPAHQVLLTNGFFLFIVMRFIARERHSHNRVLSSRG